MASINGITVKNLKTFYGHEGEPCFQGNLYLGGKKIGFWSQDAHGAIMDNVDLDSAYSEIYLRKQIEEINKNKAIHGKSMSGQDYTIEYSVENLMTDLIVLLDEEKAFKQAIKKGYSMIMIVTDSYHVTTWPLSSEYIKYDDAMIKVALAKEIEQTKSKMFKNEEIKIKFYRSLDDFNIGEKISLEDIRKDETRARLL